MEESPLRERHEARNARMLPFAGWRMPIQYRSILEEARKVRAAVGLFDLCHMGRLRISGEDALAYLQHVLSNDISKIKAGVIRYALLCREDGGVLDDVLVYRDPEIENSFFVVVNAGNREEDLVWLRSHLRERNCEIKDQSKELAMIALQGPRSEQVLQRICAADLGLLGYYNWIHTEVSALACSVSRTGYTGEDGFEIYYPVAEAGRIWDDILSAGEEEEIEPIGLAARDSLRLEAGMALYGHELTTKINPYEAGLGWAVKLGKDFIGRDALLQVKKEGPAKKLVGLVAEGRRVPRQGQGVLLDDADIGFITSGTLSVLLEKCIAMAFVRTDASEPGTELTIQIRDTKTAAKVVPLPFYQRKK